MILSTEQIKCIAKGVAYWEDGPEDGLIPHRFCSAQEDVYRPDEVRFLRTCATSGIRLECRTDASALEISGRAFKGSAKDWVSLDLHVDGFLMGHFETTLAESDHFRFCQMLPQGEKTVTLYLPCMTGVEILEMGLPDATVVDAVSHKERILFMGDSITQGYNSHYPSITYPAQIAAHYNADYMNQAIGGEMFHPEILTPLDWKPTMAIIAYGTNDWALKDRERLTQDAGDFLERFHALYPELPTVVLTPIWRADALTRREDDFRHTETDSILQEIAARYPNMKTISGQKLFPKIQELFEDLKLHPGELGFTIYAKRILAALDEMHFA